MQNIEKSAGQDISMKYDFGTTDITGWLFFGTIKSKLADADADAAATARGTATGTSITLTFPGADTAALATGNKPQKYYIDAKAVRPSDGAIMNLPPDGPDILIVSPSATKRTS